MNPYALIGAAVVAVAAIAGAYWTGYRGGASSVQAEWNTEKLGAENQAETLRLLRQGAVNQIDKTSVAKAAKQKVIDRKIFDKVDQHVPLTLPMLHGSFRLQHDSAATGKEIDDSRAADASPVAPRTVARTVTGNYESAREDKERLEELQAIVRASGCFDFDGR